VNDNGEVNMIRVKELGLSESFPVSYKFNTLSVIHVRVLIDNSHNYSQKMLRFYKLCFYTQIFVTPTLFVLLWSSSANYICF